MADALVEFLAAAVRIATPLLSPPSAVSSRSVPASSP